jgi:uncharacterized damage-inducible protein DinB
MTPEQAKFLLDIFQPSVRKEHATTLRVLQAVPAGHESYRPHPNSRSTLELVWHIASVDIWFLDIALWYEDEFPPKLANVVNLPAEFWAKQLPFFGIFNLPAVMYLQFMLNHTIHHRGQLSAYLRPMGGKVPNVYGGSFDEPMESTDKA